MIAAGPFANYVPGKPELPDEGDPNTLMVFSSKDKQIMHWFINKNTDELK